MKFNYFLLKIDFYLKMKFNIKKYNFFSCREIFNKIKILLLKYNKINIKY